MKLLFLLILVSAALQWRSSRKCLQTLEAALQPSAALVEPGEKFALILTLTNRGWLFLPFLRYRIPIPEDFHVHLDSSHIQIEGGYLGAAGKRTYVTGTTWLGPRQRLEKRIPVSIEKRGYYTFSELTVYGGDFLGLHEQPRSFSRFREVVVYPKAAPRQDIAPVFGGFLGDMSVRRFLQEDPVLTLGYREYTGREPMKTISWPQSARRGTLMVKNFDHTLEPSASVIVNIEGGGEDRQARLERCFSLARSVCQELEHHGVPYDFRMNAMTRGSVSAGNFITEGLGSVHFYRILEQLGRATDMVNCPCRVMLDKAAVNAVSSHGVILITPEPNPEAAFFARRYAEQSGGSLLILTAEGETEC